MFGSFIGSGIGRICQIAGVILFFVIIAHGGGLMAIPVSGGLVGVGTYLVWVSHHTVRVRR